MCEKEGKRNYVCVSMCAWDKEGEREKERKKNRVGVGERRCLRYIEIERKCVRDFW